MKYIERKTKKIINIKDQKSLIFLYKTIPGRIILKIITQPVFSKITGHLINSKLSKIYIKRFIQKNNIDMTKYKKETYKNFNDFFTRNVNNPKPEKDINKNLLISPCDAKLMVYEIKENLTINFKNSTYNIETLIKEKPNIDLPTRVGSEIDISKLSLLELKQLSENIVNMINIKKQEAITERQNKLEESIDAMLALEETGLYERSELEESIENVFSKKVKIKCRNPHNN